MTVRRTADHGKYGVFRSEFSRLVYYPEFLQCDQDAEALCRSCVTQKTYDAVVLSNAKNI